MCGWGSGSWTPKASAQTCVTPHPDPLLMSAPTADPSVGARLRSSHQQRQSACASGLGLAA